MHFSYHVIARSNIGGLTKNTLDWRQKQYKGPRFCQKALLKFKTSSFRIQYLNTVTNKEICLVKIVSYLCKVLCHLFARLVIEKKRPFFLAIEFAVSTSLLCHNRYYNIVRFQIDLVILASSINFDN